RHGAALGVALTDRTPVGLDEFAVDIDEPDLAYPRTGVAAELLAAVVAGRRVHHLDEEQDIVRPRDAAPVEVRPGPEHEDVRLRLRRVVEPEGKIGDYEGVLPKQE